MTYRTGEDHARETGDVLRLLRGMVRRMAVTLTSAARWQLLGQRGGVGGDETVNVEPFTGIGFYSRPPSSGNPEAVVAAVGGMATSVVVATRDEKTRQAVAGQLAIGETAIYNDKAIIVVKADGSVEIRLTGGVAIPLATKADVAAAVATFNSHTHGGITSGAGFTSSPANALGPIVAAAPVGTTVLKAQ